MSDTNTTVTPPATPPAPTHEDISAINARFDALQALIESKLPAATVVEAQAKGHCLAARALLATWSGTKATGRAIACAYRVLNGLKTILFFVLSGGLALATELQAIDLTPYVEMLLPAGAHVSGAQVITLLSLAGIGLRLITTTPIFVRWSNSFRGVGGASDSKVDDPEDTSQG
jgi:hypothetical protein